MLVIKMRVKRTVTNGLLFEVGFLLINAEDLILVTGLLVLLHMLFHVPSTEWGDVLLQVVDACAFSRAVFFACPPNFEIEEASSRYEFGRLEVFLAWL